MSTNCSRAFVKCPDCEYISKSTGGLAVHRSKLHNIHVPDNIKTLFINRLFPEGKPVYCCICDVSIGSMANFRRHMKNIHGKISLVETAQCLVCNKKYKSGRGAGVHLRTHNPDSISGFPHSPTPVMTYTEQDQVMSPHRGWKTRSHSSPDCNTTSGSVAEELTGVATDENGENPTTIQDLFSRLFSSPTRATPLPSPTSTIASPTSDCCTTSTRSPPTIPAPIPIHSRTLRCSNPEPQVHQLLRHFRKKASPRRRNVVPPSSPRQMSPSPSDQQPLEEVLSSASHIDQMRLSFSDLEDAPPNPPQHSPTSFLEDLEGNNSTQPPPRPSEPISAPASPQTPALPADTSTPQTTPRTTTPDDLNNSHEVPSPVSDRDHITTFHQHWTQTFSSDLSWPEFSNQCELFANSARALASSLLCPPSARPQHPNPAQVSKVPRRPPNGRRIARYNPTEARRLQGLYRHSKKRAARKILSANSTAYSGSRENAQAFFKDVFSSKDCDLNALNAALTTTIPCSDSNNEPLYDDMSTLEVSAKLKAAANTAPGPDRVEYRHLKRVDPQAKILLLIFNRCLLQRDVPQQWKDAVTVLIHKKGAPDDVANFRPIALMSCIYKLFTSVLGKRLSSWSIDNNILSPEQKSARPTEGCYEHTYLLQSLIGDARRNKRSTFIAWLDLRNAFGSVPHNTIQATLLHLGVPSPFVELVMNAYTNATTTIRTEQGDTDSIPLNAGVKQGCPMSPIIFNLCLELVLRAIKQKAASLSKGTVTHFNTKLSVLAYADDLVIMARDKHTLQLLLDAASTSASILGLEFRPNKCATLSFVNVKKQHQRVEENTFIVQDGPIPALSREETYRYLGVPIGLIHNIDDLPSIIPQLIEDLKAISDSLLAPWQKLDAIRSFIQPCLTYALRAGNPSKQSLEPFRSTLIESLRNICDLPNRSTQAYFFASKHTGGLAFQDPTKEDDVQAIIQAIRILSSEDTAVTSVARNELRSIVSRSTSSNATPALISEYLSGSTSGRCANLNYAAGSTWTRCRNACRRLRVQFHYSETDPVSASADDSAKIRSKSISPFLHRLVQQRAASTLLELPDQGKVAKSLATDQYANGSTWSHTGLNIRFKDWRFIHKARLNLLPTNAVKARFSDTVPTCRHCAETETLPHIICHCHPGMVSIRARHNKIVDRLTDSIRFGVVTTDRAVADANSCLRPDIVIEEQKRVAIIDVTCPFDNGPAALEEAANAKINKYLGLQDHFINAGKECEILPFVIGALGSWYPPNELVLNHLGMTRSYKSLFRKLCCSDVIQGSCDIFRLHLGWDQPTTTTTP